MLALSVLLAACAEPSAPVEVRSPSALRASAAVAEQVRRCYRSPRVPSAGRGIVTRLFVRYGPDGMLVGLPLLVSQQGVTAESRPYAGRMTEAARLAVIRCNPVRLPPEAGKRRADRLLPDLQPPPPGLASILNSSPAFAGPLHKRPGVSPSPSGEGLGWGLSARLTDVSAHSPLHSPPQPLP